MSSTLPDDIIPAILSRVPVKDLIRYRSVSKLWRSLIDGSDFIKLHLTHSYKSRGAIARVSRGRQLYWIHLGSPRSAAKLPNPIAGDAAGSTEVISSCNGLVVLKNSSDDMAIWNPATRKHLLIPDIPKLRSPCYDVKIGFGHDPVNDEYKLLRKVQDPVNSVVTVYSLKSKSWRTVEGLPYTNSIWGGYALVSNAMHWFVEGSDLMFAFDVAAERFIEVPQPKYDGGGDGDSGSMEELVELKERLCLVCRHRESGRCVVWMMKEYGAGESWTKLLSVGPTEMGVPFTYLHPVAFVDGDRKILLEKDGRGLALYDLRSKIGESVEIWGVARQDGIRLCVESLVRLDWDL